MSRCMFASPVTGLQQIISEMTSPFPINKAAGPSPGSSEATHPTRTIPFQADPACEQAVECIMEEDGCLVASFDSSVPGYFIGGTPLNSGKYSWKVQMY